jgi:hypothetical protein
MLMEVALPGGTILALMLWLCSSQAKGQFCEPQPVAVRPATIALFLGLPETTASLAVMTCPAPGHVC